jgi:ABC-type transport system involved in multi-copper enzyme maturation permease subunit
MIPFGRLFAVEVHRALSRRAVRLLIGVALLGIALTGLIAFISSDDFDPNRADLDIARLTDLWVTGGADGALTATLLFLAVGAIIGGATVTGAEWQHGTIVTVAIWEVRRVRLLSARILSAVVLAGAIGLALLVLFCLSLVPTYLLRGATDGADVAFWRELALALARLTILTAMAAGLGAAIASIGRRTTVAVGAAFAYLAIIEPIVRGLWPARGRWLLAENTAVLVTAADLDGAEFTRSVATAAVTLGGYLAVLVAVALVLFHRRDLAGAS